MDFASPTGYGLINASKLITDSELQAMAAALEIQLQRDFCPAYNIPLLPVQVFDTGASVTPGFWYLNFVDEVTEEGDLAYHSDVGGNIFANVQMAVLKKYGCGNLSTDSSKGAGPDSVSSACSHELLEMSYDPMCNLWAPTVTPIDGQSQMGEVCDPVQECYYSINGVQVCDFVLPPYWLLTPPAGAQFDQMNVLDGPFKIANGGYALMADAQGNTITSYGATPPSKMRMEVMGRRKKIRLGGRGSSMKPVPAK